MAQRLPREKTDPVANGAPELSCKAVDSDVGGASPAVCEMRDRGNQASGRRDR